MFVSLPFNGVVALDGKTGKELWRYEHDLTPEWEMCCGPSNRGVAIHENQLFFGTVDARLISLNIKTGAKIWDKKVVGNQVKTESISSLDRSDTNRKKRVTGGTGVGISMAPVVYKNQVIIGITGVGYGLHLEKEGSNTSLGSVVGLSGRFGRSGFLAAYDISTGEQKWQFNTIPPKGWEGKFTNYTEDGTVLNRDIYYEKQNFPLFFLALNLVEGQHGPLLQLTKLPIRFSLGLETPHPK